MTYCVKLAEKRKNGKVIKAWKMQDKYSALWRYEISITSESSGFEIETIKTAETTWRKKYNAL